MKSYSFLSDRSAPRLRGAEILLASGVAALAAWLPGTAQAQNAQKPTGKDYVLAHKSVYTPSSSTRNPFWPIGWVPTAPVPTAAEAAPVATVGPESFIVSSISLDYPPLAVINKRTYGVGDRIPLPDAGTVAGGKGTVAAGAEFVTVRQIADGTVTLDHRGKLMRVTTTVQSSGKR